MLHRSHFRLILVAGVFAASVLFLWEFSWGQNSAIARVPSQISPVKFRDLLPDFSGKSDDEIVQVRENIEKWRRGSSHILKQQLQDKQLSFVGKAETIVMLGNLRDSTASELLIQNLNFNIPRWPDDPTMATRRRAGFVARTALIKIGPYAFNRILRVIATPATEESHLGTIQFDESQIKGFAEVMVGIEGKRYALLKLKDEQAAHTSPTIKAQFQSIINHVIGLNSKD